MGPNWLDVFGCKMCSSTFGSCPTLAVNLATLASGSIETALGQFAIILSCAAALYQPLFVPAMFHAQKGPPANSDKYRLLDVEAPDASIQLLYVFVVDVSSIMYRMGIITLLYVSVGLAITIAYFVFCYCLLFILQWENMSALPFPRVKFALFTCVSYTMIFLIYDPSFEPTAAHDVQCRQAYPFRLLLAAIGVCTISMSYETLLAWHDTRWIWIAIVFTTTCLVIWALSYPKAMSGVFNEQRQEKALQANAFFAKVAQMRVKKMQEAGRWRS